MVERAPDVWKAASGNKWTLVDEIEFIVDINQNGSWDLDTLQDVQLFAGDSTLIFWRRVDLSEGGAFPTDKVTRINWAVP